MKIKVTRENTRTKQKKYHSKAQVTVKTENVVVGPL